MLICSVFLRKKSVLAKKPGERLLPRPIYRVSAAAAAVVAAVVAAAIAAAVPVAEEEEEQQNDDDPRAGVVVVEETAEAVVHGVSPLMMSFAGRRPFDHRPTLP